MFLLLSMFGGDNEHIHKLDVTSVTTHDYGYTARIEIPLANGF